MDKFCFLGINFRKLRSSRPFARTVTSLPFPVTTLSTGAISGTPNLAYQSTPAPITFRRLAVLGSALQVSGADRTHYHDTCSNTVSL